MPLLTQGKTNWKYILIVITLASIVGAGILWWTNQQDFPIEFPEIKKPEETELSEEEIIQPEEVLEEFVSEFKVFSREVSHKGDIWQYSHLPVRVFSIPEETKINRVEAYLEALNYDPEHSRNVGIAIGPEIPDDCRGGYYLNLSSRETAEKNFNLDTNLFKPGINKITAWVSIEAEWGGDQSWVSLTLKIHYEGQAPRLQGETTILKGPINPIECTPLGIYRNKKYKYEVDYPEDWSFYELAGEETVDFYPPGEKPQLGGRGRAISISVINWWYPEDRTYEEWLNFLITEYPQLYQEKKDIIFGKGNYEGTEMREKKSHGGVSRTVSLVDDSLVYNISIIDENSPYISVFNQILSTFRFLD